MPYSATVVTAGIALAESSTLPIYRQIYLRFRQSIAEGVLQPGDRVPSVRALAADLNLARGTVETAYQLLIGEGYLIARGPAGTVVSPQIKTATASVPLVSSSASPSASPSAPGPASPGSPASVHPGSMPLPLQVGLPALDAFPRKLWNRLATREMRQSGLNDLIYPDSRGYAPLRAAIATYLGISRGIACSAEQVFVCAGYRASLDLICRALSRYNDTCWLEDPGYFMARAFLNNAGMQLVPVPVDQDGIDVEAGIRLAADARFAVVTPSHQSPLGVSLSLPRRHALLEWANANESWIIEDDYDSEYRYQGRPLPALKSLDAKGRVLYTGTFSKVLAPGLRLSYLVVPPRQVAHFARIADEMQNQCPRILQATLATFIEEGHFARHISKMRSLYAARRASLAEALHVVLGAHLHVTLQAGGMHLLAMLAAGWDDQAIASRAQDAGLAVHALSPWYLAAPPQRGLLAGFTNVPSPEAAHALARRLASAFVEGTA